MATKKKSAPKKVSVELDSRSAFAFHGLLQEGLTASNVLFPKPEKKTYALSSKKTKIKIDAKAAKHISDVIKKGLISSEALFPKK